MWPVETGVETHAHTHTHTLSKLRAAKEGFIIKIHILGKCHVMSLLKKGKQ